jgi:mono/diheme cytochrome c family protein
VRSLAALAAATVIGCSGGDRSSATADTAVTQSTPPPVDTTSIGGVAIGDSSAVDSAAATGPTVVLTADSIAGASLFQGKGKCLACHGRAGSGLQGLGANLQDAEWLHGDGSFAFIVRTIRDGVARPAAAPIVMPASATALTPEEIHRIAAYVYTLSHPGSAVIDTTRITVDTGAVTKPDPPVPLTTEH